MLTCTAIVLLMFTVLSFTSVKSYLRPRQLPQTNVPAYEGALIRDRVWRPMPFLALDHIQSEFAETAVIARRGWLARDVLPRLVDCVADPDCVNPPGSSRANHRQEQTALNAILCARDYDPDGACHGDKRFRMTSDFENDADPVQPTADETDWNDVVFYTRRNHALKPYRRFLRRRARGE